MLPLGHGSLNIYDVGYNFCFDETFITVPYNYWIFSRGGFALDSGNSVANYVLLENYKAMLGAVHKYGRIY